MRIFAFFPSCLPFKSLAIVHRPTHVCYVNHVFRLGNERCRCLYVTDNLNCARFLDSLGLSYFRVSLPSLAVLRSSRLLFLYVFAIPIIRFLLSRFLKSKSIYLTHDYNTLSLMFASAGAYSFVQDGIGLISSLNNKNSIAHRSSIVQFMSPSLYYGRSASAVWLMTHCAADLAKYYRKTDIKQFSPDCAFSEIRQLFDECLPLIPAGSVVFLGQHLEPKSFERKFFMELKVIFNCRLYYKPHPSLKCKSTMPIADAQLLDSHLPIELWDNPSSDIQLFSLFSSTNTRHIVHHRLLSQVHFVDDRIVLDQHSYDAMLYEFVLGLRQRQDPAHPRSILS